MNRNLKLVINNPHNQITEKQFFEKNELKVILDLYAKMVSEGTWKDYGLNISSRQVSFSVFKNATENALYKICKNFKPNSKNLKYLITDSNGKILKNSFDLEILLKNTNWKNLKNKNYLLCPNNLSNIINKFIKSKYRVKAPITAFLPINSPVSLDTNMFLIF